MSYGAVSSNVVVLFLLIHYLLSLPLFVGLCIWFLLCYVVLSVISSFAIIFMRKESWLIYFNYLLDV